LHDVICERGCMKRKEWIHLIIIIGLLVIGFYKYRGRTYSGNRSQLAMDTLIEISVLTKHKNVNAQLDKAFSMVTEYEDKFSYFNERSVLSNINNSPDIMQSLDEDIYQILQLAERLYYESNHLYDVSIGNLVDIWDFSKEIVPTEESISEALSKTGFDNVEYTETTIRLQNGIRLNFGSICKGYIIDKVMEYLISQNPEEAKVNAGGDMRLYSDGKRKWRVGIQHPRDSESIIANLNIPDMAVVTSGDYERFFMVGGKRYHHILNPLTGYPTDMTVSVTILSPSAFLADALSTAAFVMNPNDAMKLVRTFPDTEAIIYFYDQEADLHTYYTSRVVEWTDISRVKNTQ